MNYRVIGLDELPSFLTEENTNLFVIQVRSNHDPNQWLDYASIKDQADLDFAKRLLPKDPNKFRLFGRMEAVMPYQPTHLQRWQTPQYYFGAQWPECYTFLGQSRGADCLTRSNYRVALQRLRELNTELPEEHEEGVDSVFDTRQSHFAVGWVEIILIHQSNQAALRLADEMAERLEQYPVLCEEDWSMLEHEEADDCWRSFGLADRIHACQKYRVSIFAARRDEIPEDTTGDIVPYLAGP